MLCEPPASFLLIILDTISGMQPTVAVTSRRAYSFLSAGSRLLSAPITQTPCSFAMRINSLCSREVLYPGIVSSLSMVPPVCPRPLPLIIASVAPRDAAMGATASVVLSPTPPVLCLSTDDVPNCERSSISPEAAIARVSATVSSSFIPRRYIAISSALI